MVLIYTDDLSSMLTEPLCQEEKGIMPMELDLSQYDSDLDKDSSTSSDTKSPMNWFPRGQESPPNHYELIRQQCGIGNVTKQVHCPKSIYKGKDNSESQRYEHFTAYCLFIIGCWGCFTSEASLRLVPLNSLKADSVIRS